MHRTAEERSNLKLKVWFPWLNLILIAGAIGIVAIMMLSDSGGQVLTGYTAAGAVATFSYINA